MVNLDDENAHVGVVDALDAMSDSHDEFAFLAHSVNEFHWVLALVVGLAKLACSRVQSTTETVSLFIIFHRYQLNKRTKKQSNKQTK